METPTKAELMAEIEAAHQGLNALIHPFTPAQLEAPGPDGGWSVKDHIIHLTAWEAGMAALLHRQPRWEAMGLDLETVRQLDEAQINALIQERGRSRSWQEVHTAYHQAQQSLLAALAPLSDTDIVLPYSAYQTDPAEPPRERRVLDYIIGNSVDHYTEHHKYIQTILDASALS